MICSGEQIHAETEFSSWGLVVPQSSIDPNQLNVFCSYIVEQCKQRNISGHIEIDFLIFVDSKTEKENIWVSDLSIGYSEHVSYYRVMRYVTTGDFNPQTHLFTIKSRQMKQRLRNWQNGAPSYIVTEKTRYAIWSSKLYHKNLSNLHYSLFFQICRSHGIGFDIREKQGTIFTLLEADQHEHLGMITISETLQTTLANFICYLNAIHQEMMAITTNKPEENNFLVGGYFFTSKRNVPLLVRYSWDRKFASLYTRQFFIEYQYILIVVVVVFCFDSHLKIKPHRLFHG